MLPIESLVLTRVFQAVRHPKPPRYGTASGYRADPVQPCVEQSKEAHLTYIRYRDSCKKTRIDAAALGGAHSRFGEPSLASVSKRAIDGTAKWLS